MGKMPKDVTELPGLVLAWDAISLFEKQVIGKNGKNGECHIACDTQVYAN